jgi:RsiW-degrading membrane proteinase PrsW (M82 family)
MKVWSSQYLKKNFFLILYLGSWSLLATIWLIFLIAVLNSTITFADVRVGRVVAWGAAAFVLSFIPVLHILLFLYWYLKQWRSKNNLIYVLTCLLIIIISFVWSSNYISRSVEKDKKSQESVTLSYTHTTDLFNSC